MNTSPSVSRRQAASHIGVSSDTLKAWARSSPPRGPSFVKLGSQQQSRTLYPLDEIERWRRDPVVYEQQRQGGHHADRGNDR